MTIETKNPNSDYRETGYSELLRSDWHYLDKPQETFDNSDWTQMITQRRVYYAEQQAHQALRMLTIMRDDPSFGYPVNTYQHCLQSATMAMNDGHDEETIVVALFHDIGFITCPDSHGSFAADLLCQYISEGNDWMLRHHAVFQQFHCHDYPLPLDRFSRDKWRDNLHFDWTVEFVAKYDQNAMLPDYRNAPLSEFEPMVRNIFARSPKSNSSDNTVHPEKTKEVLDERVNGGVV